MSKYKMVTSAGFTLVGLLIAITIAGILMAIGVPSLQAVSLNGTLKSYSSSIVASAQLARSEESSENGVRGNAD